MIACYFSFPILFKLLYVQQSIGSHNESINFLENSILEVYTNYAISRLIFYTSLNSICANIIIGILLINKLSKHSLQYIIVD